MLNDHLVCKPYSMQYGVTLLHLLSTFKSIYSIQTSQYQNLSWLKEKYSDLIRLFDLKIGIEPFTIKIFSKAPCSDIYKMKDNSVLGKL